MAPNSEPDFRAFKLESPCWCAGSRSLDQLRLMGHDADCATARRADWLNRQEAYNRPATPPPVTEADVRRIIREEIAQWAANLPRGENP